MTDVQEQTPVPKAANELSQGLKKLLLAVVANHKAAAAAGVAVEIGLDLAAAFRELGPALADAGLLGDEVKTRPVGAAKALVVAALEAAEVLHGEVVE